MLARVDHVDGVGPLAGDVRLRAVRCERDAARARADLQLGNALACGDVDHFQLVVLLRAHVDEPPVGREHGVLGVLAADLDPEHDRVGRGVDEGDAVRQLDRGGDELAIGGDVDAFGRLAEVDALRHRALVEIDHQERVRRLVRDVRKAARSVDRRAARLAAGLDLADHLVPRRVDQRDRAAVLVADDRGPGQGHGRGRDSGDQRQSESGQGPVESQVPHPDVSNHRQDTAKFCIIMPSSCSRLWQWNM